MNPQNTDKADQDATEQWVKESRLFNHWQQIKQEIMLHKWYESEKAGHDIGWERAEADSVGPLWP